MYAYSCIGVLYKGKKSLTGCTECQLNPGVYKLYLMISIDDGQYVLAASKCTVIAVSLMYADLHINVCFREVGGVPLKLRIGFPTFYMELLPLGFEFAPTPHPRIFGTMHLRKILK